MLVRFDYVASRIVDANHGVVSATAMLSPRYRITCALDSTAHLAQSAILNLSNSLSCQAEFVGHFLQRLAVHEPSVNDLLLPIVERYQQLFVTSNIHMANQSLQFQSR